MTIHETNWKNKKLENHYKHLHKFYNDYLFNLRFGSSYSSKITLDVLKKNPNFNILDVGIGNGNLYRLLKINKINNNYLGADISENYVNLSKKLFSKNNFVLTDEKTSLNLESKYDIVYSRNVALHQTNPYSFINNLIEKTKFILIIELRTRDIGKTNLDVNNSCQLCDDVWVPYIVLNYSELLNYLLTHNLCKNSKILINRDYQVLGGKNGRYLEKDLYEKNTKSSNTVIKIEFSKNNLNNNIQNQTKIEESFEKDILVKKNLYYYFMLLLNKLRIKLTKI